MVIGCGEWEDEDISDLATSPATTALTFAPPVGPKSNVISQSSSSSSLSEGAWIGTPSGRSKSASGHSSRGKMRVGAGIGDMLGSE